MEELQQHVSALRQQCSRLQKDLRRVQGDNAALTLELEQRERDLGEQRRRMHDLQGTIHDQRADIRSALDMVSGGACMLGTPFSNADHVNTPSFFPFWPRLGRVRGDQVERDMQ